jgi:predicted dehydrogenase
MDKVRIGIIGCGAISGAYLKFSKLFPNIIEIAALADLDVPRAQAKATEFAIPKACTVKELLKDKSIELVVNLTIPMAHAPVDLMAIKAGKHVYSEKPLGIDRKEGKKVMAAAAKKGVRVGGAPDTFFGAGHQTARKLIDDGAIGRPVAATAFMLNRGHESWHPSPEFYYKPGGGPMMDMGPYYLTALINMLGPIKRVTGFAATAIPERTITSQPLNGTKIAVEVPDHIAGTIEFVSGAIATIVTSFAVAGSPHPPITVFGTEGTLAVPDPNGFDGAVKIRRGVVKTSEWADAPFTHTLGYGRIVGAVDMAAAIRGSRPHRASGDLTFHVLDAMQGFTDASTSGKAHNMTTQLERPAALPAGLALGAMD